MASGGVINGKMQVNLMYTSHANYFMDTGQHLHFAFINRLVGFSLGYTASANFYQPRKVLLCSYRRQERA